MLDLLAQATYTYTTTTTQTDEGLVAAILATFAALSLILLPLLIFTVVCMWKVFEKAGVEGWKALIPFYNGWVTAEISGKPGWWGIVGVAGIIPIVGWIASIAAFVFWILIMIELAKSFGKEPAWSLLLIFIPVVGYAMLAFGDAKYAGPGGKSGGAKPAATKTA